MYALSVDSASPRGEGIGAAGGGGGRLQVLHATVHEVREELKGEESGTGEAGEICGYVRVDYKVSR